MAFETVKFDDYLGTHAWQSMIDSLDQFSSDFLKVRNQLNDQQRESLD